MPTVRELPLSLKIILNVCAPIGVALALLGFVNGVLGLVFLAIGVVYVSWELYPSTGTFVRRRPKLSLPIFLGVGALVGFILWVLLLRIGNPSGSNAGPRIDIQEPVIHLEPENELLWSTKLGQRVGEFRLTFANTGTEDIDHIGVIEDYFIALRFQDGRIIIKNVGGVPVESGVPEIVESKKSSPLLINFSSNIGVMNEVVRNNGLPSMRGVRLTITFRRKSDGRAYRIVKGFGAVGTNAEGLLPPGVPQDNFSGGVDAGLLSMGDIVPYLDIPGYWVPVTHAINQDANGGLVHRYH